MLKDNVIFQSILSNNLYLAFSSIFAVVFFLIFCFHYIILDAKHLGFLVKLSDVNMSIIRGFINQSLS